MKGEHEMAYYKIEDNAIDIHCGNTDAWERGCSGGCESCGYCEVEEFSTGKTYPYVDSKYDKETSK